MLCGPAFRKLGFFFLSRFDGDALVLNVQPEPGVNAHVLVGDPHQGKQRHQISAPVVEQELGASDDQKQNGDVVAEAEFASK
jgi:hypothetical protein